MTVAKLIELLNRKDPNSKVVVEGCDCADDAVGISAGSGAYKDDVIIRRAEGAFSNEEEVES